MADTSEETSQPATDKKLKDARQKGQVAKSQDLVSGMVILFCTLCISILAPRAMAQVTALIDLTAQIYIEPFATAWPRVLDHAEQLVIGITLPVMAVTIDGDPLIKSERRRQRNEMQALATKLGLGRASMIIGTTDGWVIGVRYVRGETPVPVIVCRASPEEALLMLQEAYDLGIPHAPDKGLAAEIARRTVLGDPVPDASFQAVADWLVVARLI